MSALPNATRSPPNCPALDPSGWVRNHADALFRYALLRVHSADVAEDLVQDTFLGALASRDQFRRQSSERTWLTGILRRKIADHFRSRGIVETVPYAEDLTRTQIRERACDQWSGDPARLAENAEFWQVLRQCAGGLTPALAEVYSLREFCELSIDAIAKLLGITPANVSLRLFRARADLRDCLEKNWFVGEGE
jgi:RNA polymerase sigma-70 factor (TIGR02943 family)